MTMYDGSTWTSEATVLRFPKIKQTDKSIPGGVATLSRMLFNDQYESKLIRFPVYLSNSKKYGSIQ